VNEFDPIHAAREELIGLSEVMTSLTKRERSAEEAISQAESELNGVRKIVGFVRIAMEEKRALLKKLEMER
jgi:hypothetical protein